MSQSLKQPFSRTHGRLVDILTLGLLPDDTGFYTVIAKSFMARHRKVPCRETPLHPLHS